MERQLYFKKLDALRFIAFFLVFWQHGFAICFSGLTNNLLIEKIIYSLTYTGGIGVHVFFVISGFLITFLMIKEKNTTGHINLKFFYLRRIFRIWPLYYFVLLVGIFFLPACFDAFHFSGTIYKNLIFLNNFDMQNIHEEYLRPVWSVAIEEQFYLFWPILFIVFKNKKTLSFVCIILFTLSTVLLLIFGDKLYFNTIGNINYLMVGCIGAISYSKKKNQWLNYLLKKSIFLYFSILFILIFTILSTLFSPFSIITITLFPFIYLFIIIYLVDHENQNSPSFFSFLGKYTYGMYMYHSTIIVFVQMFFDSFRINLSNNRLQGFILAIISLITTIAVSWLSYEYFEKFFLKIKSKMSTVKTRI